MPWKQLRERRVPGPADPVERDYGLAEFVMVDPDGNRVRFGSPTN